MELTREDLLDLLYGQSESRRYTQDSPVMPDVWLAFIANPDKPVDLLLTPFQPPQGRTATPGDVAAALLSRLPPDLETEGIETTAPAAIAFHQTSVAVRLEFADLVRVVLPISRWWQRRVRRDLHRTVEELLGIPEVHEILAESLADPGKGQRTASWDDDSAPTIPPDVLWTLQVVGTIARWLELRPDVLRARRKADKRKLMETVWPPPAPSPENKAKRRTYFKGLVDAAAKLLTDLPAVKPEHQSLVYSVNLNRPAAATLWRSRETVKADAATRLFELDFSRITWAILDSGVEARLPAFRVREAPESAAGEADDQQAYRGSGHRRLKPLDKKSDWSGSSRILATYDFTVFRTALSGDPAKLPPLIRKRLEGDPEKRKKLQESLRRGRTLDWKSWEELLRIPHDGGYVAPRFPHGTHVAGILGAHWLPTEEDDDPDFGPAPEWPLIGVCPGIRMYDLRVLDERGEGDEFNVMAAIQFLQHLNAHRAVMVVQGANLSLGIRHDPANYACGATPVCDECRRATGAGLVMVAAAGNEGYEESTSLSAREGFRSINITDPGNAEAVITVGSTHREMPHLYGVSYFSSRGPTGDGRRKPDLLAPGEKIESCVHDGEVQRMDGTSMAAPHVSGAASMLLARHGELIGRPELVKGILCDSATNLGRVPEFQGAGLVDCLRALQAV